MKKIPVDDDPCLLIEISWFISLICWPFKRGLMIGGGGGGCWDPVDREGSGRDPSGIKIFVKFSQKFESLKNSKFKIWKKNWIFENLEKKQWLLVGKLDAEILLIQKKPFYQEGLEMKFCQNLQKFLL